MDTDKRIIFMGTPDFAVPQLEALLAGPYTVAGVVTRQDKPKGRKGIPMPPPVKETALGAGIPVWQPQKIKDPGFRQALEEAGPDLIVVSAYGRIIPKEILTLPPYGCINVHASLLPKYRGAAPIQHAVIDGEEYSGVTIMQMDEGLDTGDILAQSRVPLEPDETGGSLFEKLSAEGARLLTDTLPAVFAGKLHPVRQPEDSPTPYAAMLTKETGRMDFSLPAVQLERLIRGTDPWPGAFTSVQGRILKLWRAAVVTEGFAQDTAPGTVLSTGKDGILIRCGAGAILIKEVQLEGKKRMEADAFLRGFSLPTGTVCGITS